MNLVDVFVSEIITPPFQKENGEWSITIKTVCYGSYRIKTICDIKEKIDRYVVGYKWLE